MVESAAQPIPWQELLLGNAPAPQLTTLPVLLGIRQWNGNPDWRDKYRTLKQMEALLRQALLENDSMGDCLRLDEAVLDRFGQRVFIYHIFERHLLVSLGHQRCRCQFQSQQRMQFVQRLRPFFCPVMVRLIHNEHKVR